MPWIRFVTIRAPSGVNDKAKRIAAVCYAHVASAKRTGCAATSVWRTACALRRSAGTFWRPVHPSAIIVTSSPLGPVGWGSRYRVVTVQQWLSKMNLIPFFAVTGQYDALTRQAIRKFPECARVPANGLLDDRTAALLAQAARVQPPITSGFRLVQPAAAKHASRADHWTALALRRFSLWTELSFLRTPPRQRSESDPGVPPPQGTCARPILAARRSLPSSVGSLRPACAQMFTGAEPAHLLATTHPAQLLAANHPALQTHAQAAT